MIYRKSAPWSVWNTEYLSLLVFCQPCDTVSRDRLTCLSLNVRRHLVNTIETDAHLAVRLAYGLIMDGVQRFRNITKMVVDLASVSRGTYTSGDALTPPLRDRKVRRSRGGVSLIPRHLAVFPDPQFDSFVGVKQFYFNRNEYLNLNVSFVWRILAVCRLLPERSHLVSWSRVVEYDQIGLSFCFLSLVVWVHFFIELYWVVFFCVLWFCLLSWYLSCRRISRTKTRLESHLL